MDANKVVFNESLLNYGIRQKRATFAMVSRIDSEVRVTLKKINAKIVINS